MTPIPRNRAAIPVLMYHSIGVPARSSRFAAFVHSRELFAAHLDALLEAGFTPVRACDVLAAFAGQRVLPPRPVAITFDDAFDDFVTSAVPELRARSMVCTVFVPTAFVGGRAAWLDEIGEGDRRILSADALRSLDPEQIEVGAHSRTHPELDRSPRRAARAEIAGSRHELEEWLDRPVRSFAYPFGYHSHAVRRSVAAAGFTGAFAVSDLVAQTGRDSRWAIPRLSAPPDASVTIAQEIGRRRTLREDVRVQGWRFIWRLKRSMSRI